MGTAESQNIKISQQHCYNSSTLTAQVSANSCASPESGTLCEPNPTPAQPVVAAFSMSTAPRQCSQVTQRQDHELTSLSCLKTAARYVCMATPPSFLPPSLLPETQKRSRACDGERLFAVLALLATWESFLLCFFSHPCAGSCGACRCVRNFLVSPPRLLFLDTFPWRRVPRFL